ncbi:MAG: 1-(5-phosphoribosyl)-5-[(5-phosphoribosylamino)methylideneamino]imidazole-4-carboxamide isomerase [Candidatus Omnitrophica bacterium]|nr:1-(5-phosphoribosyl)-5-[(5-phosphoribosylamino)methylideneamino]imidazole-4-carboxamide isomerase [Candidatus Omnitrophota bacterium]MDD5236979.1 1-(5-phosphoribosyl)-5-[(5-phosphoribosylamino)methylideneamino]imidazole-4-carboxamide isomerase [Candidatus Omnitrophota bacterium]MDD5611266.1 1-(5-phosphoribosyl)-5-[(5-phosphoribosylamino)methylideneamino]imidazole-4-carboxamide isomerase [Candidatus Omnitrophota bacterium]
MILIIPAIDLKEGKVVRFVQGKYEKKVYSSDPVNVAKHWQKLGAKMLHVVDLDGAMTGKPLNLDIAIKIAQELKIPIEFGGGVRSEALIEKLVNAGVLRVIISTKALEDENFLKRVVKKYAEKLIVSIDEHNGAVYIKGWKNTAKKISTDALIEKLKGAGIKEIIYTDISRDGTLKGPNVMGVKKVLKSSGMRVIASGGISSVLDIDKLKILEKHGLKGIIVGKALYEGRLTLGEALKRVG